MRGLFQVFAFLVLNVALSACTQPNYFGGGNGEPISGDKDTTVVKLKDKVRIVCSSPDIKSDEIVDIKIGDQKLHLEVKHGRAIFNEITLYRWKNYGDYLEIETKPNTRFVITFDGPFTQAKETATIASNIDDIPLKYHPLECKKVDQPIDF